MQKALKQTYIDDNQMMLIENEVKSEYLPPIILNNTSINKNKKDTYKSNQSAVMLNDFMQKRVSK